MSDETELGAAEYATELTPPVDAGTAPDYAWSDSTAPDMSVQRGRFGSWLRHWGLPVGLVTVAVLAVLTALAAYGDESIPAAATTTTVTVTVTATPATQTAAPDEPDSWVAIAISPSTLAGGYGIDSTRDAAVQTAITECRRDDCVTGEVIQHGCVAYANNKSTHDWSVEQGLTPDVARAAALSSGTVEIVTVQCSR